MPKFLQRRDGQNDNQMSTCFTDNAQKDTSCNRTKPTFVAPSGATHFESVPSDETTKGDHIDDEAQL